MSVFPQPSTLAFRPLSAALLMAMASLAALLGDDHAGAGIILILASLLMGIRWIESKEKTTLAGHLTRYYSLLLAGAAGAATLLNMHTLALWVYLAPLAILLVWPARIAAIWLTLWLGGLLLWPHNPLTPEYLQSAPGLMVATALASLFVWLKDYRARQMEPLRRTDTLTQASIEEHLSADLYTEIQRSEREGTDLTVILLEIDQEEPLASSEDDLNSLLRRTGRILHEQLRDFDSYYRVNNQRFLLILPYTNSLTATRTSDRLKIHINEEIRRYRLPVNLLLGMAGLNAGDNADSLRLNAEQALAKARQASANEAHPATFNDEHDT